MAYTNAIFYLDYDLGDDTARSTLSSVVFSNPSADIVLGTYVGHGLVTGAVITISGCTQAYANSSWKITRVNDDTFTLDTASWASFNGADVTGDAVPFGGQSWADAFKTIQIATTGIAAGDIVRVAKSPAPVSLSTTGDWTKGSSAITLGAAKTTTINNCEAAWTQDALAEVTPSQVDTDYKQGTYSCMFTPGASVSTSQLQAYAVTGTLDLSSYQKISFWLKVDAAIIGTQWTLNLCSDAAGATVVDTFVIPQIDGVLRWIPITLARVGGGNLGSAIESIALYSGTDAPLEAQSIMLDNIIACTSSGLNLQSLISKNSSEQGGTEGWYGIQSIDGVDVIIDNQTNTLPGGERGYAGTTESVTTYIRETIKTAMAADELGVSQEVTAGGSAGNNVQIQGGYNTSNSTQDGETFFDGMNGFGVGLTPIEYTTLNRISCVRYDIGLYLPTVSNVTVTTCHSMVNNTANGINTNTDALFNSFGIIVSASNNGDTGIILESSHSYTITTLSHCDGNLGYGLLIDYSNNGIINLISSASYNSSSGIRHFSGDAGGIINEVTNAEANGAYGVDFGGGHDNHIHNLTTASNTLAGIRNTDSKNYVSNASIGEATEVTGYVTGADSKIFSHNHDQTVYHRIFTDGGQINSLDTTRAGATGKMWKLEITSDTRNSKYPLVLPIAKIAVAASALVTVDVYMKKDHASNVAGKIVCRGAQIAGVSADVVATKANDTNWEQLEITFTPTEAGVVEIEAWAEYVAGNSNVYVGDMLISQA